MFILLLSLAPRIGSLCLKLKRAPLIIFFLVFSSYLCLYIIIMKNQVNRFFCLRSKKFHFLNLARFLLRCKKYNVTPNFIKLKCRIYGSSFVNHAVHRLHFIILLAVINQTRLNICKIEKELYCLHLKLAHSIHDFLSIDSKC